MACGRTVVATRAGGLPEVVDDGETGRLVPARDAHALADAIIELLQDPTRRDLYGRTGLERARRRFNADRMVEETLEVYRHLVDTPHAAGTVRPPGVG